MGKHNLAPIWTLLWWINCLSTTIRSAPRGHGSGGVASRTVYVDPSSFRTEYRKPDESSLPDWAKLLIGCFSIFGGVALIFIVRLCFKEYQRRKEQRYQKQPVPCYLCEEQVPKSSWISGEHRKKCLSRNKAKLASFETPKPGLRCTKCSKRTKLWPQGLGEPFKCSAPDCPILGMIQNNGQNRYNCFLCDFDLCDSCWRRKLVLQRAPNSKSQSASSGSRSNRNSRVFPEKQIEFETRQASAPPFFYPGFAYERSMTLPTYDEAIAENVQTRK